MTVLTPSPNPTTLLSPSQRTNILQLLSPALTHSLYLATIFQQLVSTTTLFLFIRAYISSLFILRQSFCASQILLMQSYYASTRAYKQISPVAKQGLRQGWKATERLRNKLFFEFMVFVLGGGSQVILAVFWPGWIVIGGAAGGIYWACG